MSILQAVLLGIIYYLGNSSIIAGPVGYYSVYRPLVRTSDTGFSICTYGRSSGRKRRGWEGLDSFCIVAAADAVCAYLCSMYAGMLFRGQLYSGYY